MPCDKIISHETKKAENIHAQVNLLIEKKKSQTHVSADIIPSSTVANNNFIGE